MAKRIVLVDFGGDELFSGYSVLTPPLDDATGARTPNESGFFVRDRRAEQQAKKDVDEDAA